MRQQCGKVFCDAVSDIRRLNLRRIGMQVTGDSESVVPKNSP